MDIARPDQARKRRRRRLVHLALALVFILIVTVGLSRLKPAAPSVDRNLVSIDTVKRGLMLRQVRGNGTLVPEEIRWIPTPNLGRVERINVLPGAAVTADTVIVELSNPELENAAFEAEWQLKGAQAQTTKLEVQLESERLSQEATAAALEAECSVARLDAEADAKLYEEKLVDRLTTARSRTRAEQLTTRCELERKRLQIMADSRKAQLAAQEAEISRLRAFHELKRRQVESLRIRAGIDGVLQKLGDTTQLQVGQQLAPGANVARVANPARLKAEVRIPETQARDLELGQVAAVDTRNGVVPGRVVRIDPAAQNGTVTVDLKLEGPLPKGARPDLTVEGIVELERLPDVLHVGRMVNAQTESTVGIFKLTNNGKEAHRIPVTLGRSSVSTIEIVSGLEVGDQVILSDMSQWDAHDRVRLN